MFINWNLEFKYFEFQLFYLFISSIYYMITTEVHLYNLSI